MCPACLHSCGYEFCRKLITASEAQLHEGDERGEEAEAKLQTEDMNSEHRVRVSCGGPDKGEPATGVQARAANKGATGMDGLDIDQTLSGGFMSSLPVAISK